MKKVVYPKIGGPDSIEIVEAKDPVAGPGEVRVRVHRAGINFADLMMRQGLYGSAPDFPFTPGYEASGEVLDVGSGVERVAWTRNAFGGKKKPLRERQRSLKACKNQ